MSTSFDLRWHGAVINQDRWHFHRRLLERYGVVLGPADYSRISGAVARGGAALIEPKADGSAVYLVRIPSTGALIFVAAKPNGELITALSVNERLIALCQLQPVSQSGRQRSLWTRASRCILLASTCGACRVDALTCCTVSPLKFASSMSESFP